MSTVSLEEPRTHVELSMGEPTWIARGSPPPSRRPRRRWWRWALAAAGVLLVGWASLHSYHLFFRPVTVETAFPQLGLPVQVFGLGTVGARVQSNVAFKVAGVLNQLDADEGDRVAAGTVLARLDSREIQAQLGQARAGVIQADASIAKARADIASAEAGLANAVTVAKRRAELVKSGYASLEETQTTKTAELTAAANLGVARSELDVAQATRTAAVAQVTLQQATLDDYTLSAPYDAWVVSRNLQLGSMPNPGQAVFTLVDPASIWVLAYIDERLAGSLAVGQTAIIKLRSQPGRTFPGHVARIEIQSDAVNEERLVEVAFDATPADIHLAEQAEVVITTGTLPHAVAVPRNMVSDLKDGHGTVWTVEGGRIARRTVTFGAALLDGKMPVIAGLPDGASVVTIPAFGLRVGKVALAGAEHKQ